MYVLSRYMKISEFLFENFQLLEVKFSIYLNRCVFVMSRKCLYHKAQDMKNEQWQDKRHRWKYRSTSKEKLQKMNRLGTVSRVTTYYKKKTTTKEKNKKTKKNKRLFKWKFSDKKLWYFHISAQNIDCETILASTHNLCFLAEIRKIMYTPVNPSFTI